MRFDVGGEGEKRDEINDRLQAGGGGCWKSWITNLQYYIPRARLLNIFTFTVLYVRTYII